MSPGRGPCCEISLFAFLSDLSIHLRYTKPPKLAVCNMSLYRDQRGDSLIDCRSRCLERRASRFVSGLFAVPHLVELNIGHSIVSRSITVGLPTAVKEMLVAMQGYPGPSA